jgi:5'-nucleotidase/UDP-sugar diphosphatase
MKPFLFTAGLLLMTLTPALQAAPKGTTKEAAAKDAVQVQTALSGAGSSSKETNLGDLVADAVRQTGSAQAALIPADEIDGSALIPAGKTDAGKIIATLHYADDPSDAVVVLNLTGAQLLKVAERSVSRAPEPFDGFLQVSGLQIRYNASQPEGKRVSLVGIGGSEVDAAKSYKVATTRSLAGGGLGYYQIWTSKDITDDTGTTLAKSLGSYLSAHAVISSAVENRISKN